MEKIVKLVFIFLCSVTLLFGDFDSEFASIQKQMQTSPSKAYTDLQGLYLHLILEGNDAQKIQVLNALVETSKKLNFNYERYESALKELRPKPKTPPQKTPQTAKVQKVVLQNNALHIDFDAPTKPFRSFALQSDKIRYVYDFYAVLPDVSKSFSYGTSQIKVSQFDKNIIRVVIASKQNIAIAQEQSNNRLSFVLPLLKQKISYDKDANPSKITNVSFKNGKLQIDFDAKTAFKNFILEKDKIRYVYDFKTVFPDVSKSFTHQNNDIKLSQFDATTTRLVITTDAKQNFTPQVTQNSFVLAFAQNTQTTPSIVAQASKKLRVVIDPGHGGNDPGAVGYKGYREKVVVFDFSVAVKKYLEQSGIEVILTRDKDTFLPLEKRTIFANDKNADIFISIHANAAESSRLNGIETYFLSPARSERAKRVAAKENKEVMDKMAEWSSKNTFLTLLNREKIIESNKLAIDIQKNMLFNVTRKYKDVRDGGVREAPFWVLVGAQMPAVLVELGYITNAKEANRLVLKKYSDYQDAIARGIAEGVINYLSIAKKF
jgi:N-acetylmuramoyl-L-alanine amidase